MFFIWILTGWFGRAFEGWFWPLMGFIFLPYTTLVYMAAMLNSNGRLSGGWIALLILAVLFDLSGDGASASRGSRTSGG